jgi:Na+-dependent bicarbonate transporter superfamily
MAHFETVAGRPVAVRGRVTSKPSSLWDRPFYFWMSLLIGAIVVYGFSHTIDKNLMHPPTPRPPILYVHGALFTGWLAFLILQSGLVRTRNVAVHKKLGWFGFAMGALMPFVGITTAITMARLHVQENVPRTAAFMIVPFWDMVEFTVPLCLAFYWRTKPEFHRRLILMATCALTAAAFGRFPSAAFRDHWFYVGVDGLILLAVIRDLIVIKRVHPVYLYGLPVMMLGQSVSIYAYVTSSPAWLRIASAILG